MAHLFLIIETSGFLRFSEEKLNFKFSFIHILCMRLSVKEVELKIREHEKSRYFFEIFVKNMNYIVNIIMLCA